MTTAPLPHVVGRYALYGEIATGGMASVHYGRLLGPAGFSKTVAIKRLHPHLARDRDFSAMFLDEARLAARVSHPNVVPMLDVVELGDEVLLVMEYVPGATLTALIRAAIANGQLVPPEVACAIACGVLHGLHAAHEATDEAGVALGMVHRDVSPQNVLIGSDGVPRVLDFGVAKAEGRIQTTRDGQLKGKLAYMSPEQLRGQVDRRTDVYAAAVLLWETLTSRRLFAGESEPAVIGRVLEGAILPPSAHAPAVSPALDAIVLRGLSRDPQERFATARDMALAIEARAEVANPTRVARWVEELVSDTLRLHAIQVAEVENVSAPSAVGHSGARPRTDDETLTALTPSATGLRAGGTAAESPRKGSHRNVAITAALAAAAVATFGASRLWIARAHPASPAPSATPQPFEPQLPAKVLVLGIENRTQDPIFDRTLDAVLASALGRSSDVLAYTSDRFNALVEADSQPLDESLARKLAERDRKTVLTVRGAVGTGPSGYTLAVTATDSASGRVVFTATDDAVEAGRVIATVGRMATGIRAALGEAPPSNPALADQTGLSPSIEADYEFILGRGLARSGKLAEGVAHLERAALDPAFTQAHIALGVNLRNLGKRAEGDEEVRRALANVDSISERDRLAFLGFARATDEDYAGSAVAYEELLRKYPDDERAETALPGMYALLSDRARALERGRRAAERYPGKVFQQTNLAFVEIFATHLEAGGDLAEAVIAKTPHPLPHAFSYAAISLALRGRMPAAADVYAKLMPHDASLAAIGLADLALAEGRLHDGVKLLEAGIEADLAEKSTTAATAKRAMLAEARAALGDRPAALAAAQDVAASGAADLTYLAAMATLGAGQSKRAHAMAAALSRTPGQDHALWSRLIEAEALLAEGEARAAVSAATSAGRVVDAWAVHAILARIHLALGEHAEAEAEIRTCMDRRGEGAFVIGLDAPSVRLVSRLPYYLGRALEGQRRREAKDAYQTFLAACPGADHDPLVDDAKRRVRLL